MTENNRKPGRPVKEKKATGRIEFRVEVDRKEHWINEAEKQGFKSLSAYLKSLADNDSGFKPS